jgi:hypothetical protein
LTCSCHRPEKWLLTTCLLSCKKHKVTSKRKSLLVTVREHGIAMFNQNLLSSHVFVRNYSFKYIFHVTICQFDEAILYDVNNSQGRIQCRHLVEHRCRPFDPTWLTRKHKWMHRRKFQLKFCSLSKIQCGDRWMPPNLKIPASSRP